MDAEQFSQAVEKSYRKLVKKVNIPGFRKGKAPRVVFDRFVGKEVLYEDAMESLVPEAYLKAVKETGIEPIDRPQMEVVQAEEGKPVVLKAKVQVKPEVKLGEYKGLEAVKRDVEITSEDIDKGIERLRERHCKVLPLQEGVVENGDTVQIDFWGKLTMSLSLVVKARTIILRLAQVPLSQALRSSWWGCPLVKHGILLLPSPRNIMRNSWPARKRPLQLPLNLLNARNWHP